MAENDSKVNPAHSLTIIQASQQYIAESERSKQDRLSLNKRNREAYDCIQDYSNKIEGQSREFLPKTAETAEQFAAFLKKSLTQFGDWFSVEGPKKSILSDESIRRLMIRFLDNLPDGKDTTAFTTRLTDGAKVGLMESVMIFKIHGGKQVERKFKFEKGDLKTIELEPWRLKVDLIRFEDYGQDPSGKGLYEYHRSERDLHEVQRLAKQGIYDKSVVDRLAGDTQIPENEERKSSDDDSEVPSFRKRVVLHEFWGNLLNPDGSMSKERVFWTIANEKYLIRKPQPYPFWHGESPFVVIPLIRKPFSVWHKALYDQVVPLNFALNELFNLMLDGGLASVWGIKQIRLDYLDDPRQVAGGIPQGKTLAVSEDAPDDAKVMEQVSEGQVPPDAMNMFSIVDRELNASAMSNEIRQGLLPTKQVKATEVVEATQNQAVLLDAIVTDIEKHVEKLLRKAFLTMLQNADELAADEIGEDLTTRELFSLARMEPAERFAMFSGTKLKVFGLSATLSRGRDFQRIMAILQVAQQSPILLPVMMRRVSGAKLWNRLLTLSNLNPRDFERTEDDEANAQFDMQVAQQVIGGQGGSPTQPTGEAGVQSEINQETKPSSGL